MRGMVSIAIAAAVALAGLAAGGAAAWSANSHAVPGDPWNDARYYIGIKNSAEALRLIDSGAFDINMQNDEGYTLLHFAAEAGDLELVRAMLMRGANPSIRSKSLALLPYDMAYSPLVKAELRKAATAPRQGNVAAPAKASAPPNGMCAKVRAERVNDGRSPAMRPFLKAKDAIWYNHPDELTGLIEDCVKVDQQDEYGWTLLHHAADRDRVALAKILLDHGASKALRNKDGQTAAQLAKSPEMKALLGPAGPARPAPATSARDRQCQQKYRADVALCSDSTCRMRSMRKWEQCRKTGNYW